MRNLMAGLVILGLATTGTAALARPVAIPQGGTVQRADWDGDRCGRGCQEHRREVREHEHARQYRAEHRRWEDHQRWDESRYPANSYHRNY
jgi:hypothetical protein